MMTVIVGRVLGVTLATSGANIWIRRSDAGALIAAVLDGQALEVARATSPDGAWIIVPQSARVDRALRDLRYLLENLIHEPEGRPAPADVRGNVTPPDPDAELAGRLAEAWRAGASKNALARMAGFPQYGGSYVARIDRAIEWLEAEARHGDVATTAQTEPPALESDSPGLLGAGVVVE